MLASVVTHASQSKVAPAALLELRVAYELFESAAAYGGRAVKFIVGLVLWSLVIFIHEYHSQSSIVFKRKPNKSTSRLIAGSHRASRTTFSGRRHPRANLKMNSLYLVEKRTPSLPKPPSLALLPRGLALAHLRMPSSAALAPLPPHHHRAFRTRQRACSWTTRLLRVCTRA